MKTCTYGETCHDVTEPGSGRRLHHLFLSRGQHLGDIGRDRLAAPQLGVLTIEEIGTNAQILPAVDSSRSFSMAAKSDVRESSDRFAHNIFVDTISLL